MSDTLPLELYDTTDLHHVYTFSLITRGPWRQWIERLGGIRLEYRNAGIAALCPQTGHEIGWGRTVLAALRDAHAEVEDLIAERRPRTPRRNLELMESSHATE